MKRSASFLLLGALLSGCSLEIFQPAQVKINAAFPVGAEVRVAYEKLRDALGTDQPALKDVEQRYAARLELRARQCTVDAKIGRFDSVEKIRALALDKDCFHREDLQLQQLLGMRLVALYLAQPPLHPMQALGPAATLPNPNGDGIARVETAAAAGVALVSSGRGEFTSIRFPQGDKIASLPSLGNSDNRLSPNGRVVAGRKADDSLQFVSTETGEVLFETREANRFLAWLPGVSAALANGGRNAQLMLLDFQQSRLEPHPLGTNSQNWALATQPQGSEALVGGGQTVVQVKHQRESGGIKASRVREYQLAQNRYVMGAPTLMRDGHALLYLGGRDLVTLDLDSGRENVLPTAELMLSHFAKLSETTVLTDTLALGAESGPRLRTSVLDIDQGTLAPVEDGEGVQAQTAPLPGRIGFMRRFSGAVKVGDQIDSGRPERLETLVAAANLKRQLARLDGAPQGIGMQPLGIAPASIAPVAAPPLPAVAPSLDLPANARVEAVGVYQGKKAALRGPGPERAMGQVEVVVKRSAQPLVLVLSSYEAVAWNLKLEAGAQPLAVLLSGYHPSQVVNAGNLRVLRTGTSTAYRIESDGYVRLKREVQGWTGKPIAMFQGAYEGATFTVGY